MARNLCLKQGYVSTKGRHLLQWYLKGGKLINSGRNHNGTQWDGDIIWQTERTEKTSSWGKKENYLHIYTNLLPTGSTINQSINDWMNEWMSEWMNEWMNEWVNEWMHEWMSEWMNADTLGVPKERIIRSILNEENTPTPQMFGYGALLQIILIHVNF